MRKGIHPDYHPVVYVDVGADFAGCVDLLRSDGDGLSFQVRRHHGAWIADNVDKSRLWKGLEQPADIAGVQRGLFTDESSGLRLVGGAGGQDRQKQPVGRARRRHDVATERFLVEDHAPVSLVLTRFLTGLLHGVSPTDPLTFVGVSVVLAVVALLAAYLPARRALRLQPMETLRTE